jgi:hypothetical protein
MKTAYAMLMACALGMAQNPPAQARCLRRDLPGDGVTLELAGSAGAYTGTLTFQGRRCP